MTVFRKAVSVEAYQTLMLRDFYVDTFRNGTDWQLTLRLHCETADVGIARKGTWTINLMDGDGQSIQEIIASSTIYGNRQREAVVQFQMNIPSNQVCIFPRHSSLD